MRSRVRDFCSIPIFSCLLCVLFWTAAGSLTTPFAHAQSGAKGAAAMAFSLRSPDFANGADIPKQFTCSGEDLSPVLEWNDAPPGTVSFALIVDDPDVPSGNWVHWVIFNIPKSTRSLPRGFEKRDQVADGTRQGQNDFRKVGYNGPCPPPGKAHRYFFKLYALSAALSLNPGATKGSVEQAMEGRMLGRAEWMGRYRR